MSVDSIKLKIFNAALRQAQATRMARIDETSASADACFDLYDPVFDQAMAEFEWPWARDRLSVAVDATAPLGATWEARYSMPANFLRMHRVDTAGVDEYYLESGSGIGGGQFLLCNEKTGPIIIVYYQNDVPITSTSITFQRLIEKRMAAALASDLSKDRTLARHLLTASFALEQMAYRECSDWSREEEPLSLRAPQYTTGRLPSYGRI